MLRLKHLDIAKIAKVVSTLESSSLRLSTSKGGASGSRSGNYYSGDRIGSDSVDNTLSKARKNHDIQPLAKDRHTSRKPNDMYTLRTDFKSQKRLGQIEDKRLTHAHLRRGGTPLRLGSLGGLSSSHAGMPLPSS